MNNLSHAQQIVASLLCCHYMIHSHMMLLAVMESFELLSMHVLNHALGERMQ